LWGCQSFSENQEKDIKHTQKQTNTIKRVVAR